MNMPEYDEALEQAGMITGRKAVALFKAMPAEQQRKLLKTLFPNQPQQHEPENIPKEKGWTQ